MIKAVAILLASMCIALPARAMPIEPTRDDEVVETLPYSTARSEDRRLRRQLAAQPRDAALAVQVARRYLGRARDEGDPRQAGQAMAALAPWQDDAEAPIEVLLLQATLQQHLHDFEGAAERLERALAREPRQPQGWLTLATVRRVQGRYAQSDAACRKLVELGAEPYATACLAENDSLRGRADQARTALKGAIERARGNADLRSWLLTTIAELEERAGQTAAAEAAYRASLQERPDLYTALALADLLLAERRAGEVAELLQPWPRSDAVLLRLALAEPRSVASSEMRERIAQANERPGTSALHGREQSMFALAVEGKPERALELARDNVRTQREPLDVLTFARAAHAAKNDRALAEARALVAQMGLHDRRLDALL